MEEKSVEFLFQARYYKLGQLNSSTQQVWFVLHGYAQLAQYFIKKFESLTKHEICVIAPEGLSRFYLSELTDTGRKDNKVGATWMTRENRLMDIDNYLQYLDGIFKKELTLFPHVQVSLLGFSQGCATVARWASQGDIHFNRLILWAGLLPPDMNFEKGRKVLASKETILVAGDKDPFVTRERLEEFDQLANLLGIEPERIMFDGKHEIKEDVLSQLI